MSRGRASPRSKQIAVVHSCLLRALNVDQLIRSLHRREESLTTFTGLEVDPGESLADTAAQSGIIDLRSFRKAQEALLCKFGLMPRVIHSNNQAVGIGRKAKVLGKVEMPSGMGGVSGVVRYTVVDSPGTIFSQWSCPLSPDKGDSTRSQISQVVSHTRSPIDLTCLCVATSVLVIVEMMTR